MVTKDTTDFFVEVGNRGIDQNEKGALPMRFREVKLVMFFSPGDRIKASVILRNDGNEVGIDFYGGIADEIWI